MNTILDDLPNSIINKVSVKPRKLSINGMQSRHPDQTPNDLIYYPPIDNNGNNLGVMIYGHEKFKNDYLVHPHTVNFKKRDRDTFHIGKCDYATTINRYLKERKDIYSLNISKKSDNVSPLFVPYIDNVFLVIIPTNATDQFFTDYDNPPLVEDDNDTDGGLFGVMQQTQQKSRGYISDDDPNNVSDEWLDDSYIPPTHRRVSFENVDEDGIPVDTSEENQLMALFKEHEMVHNDSETKAVVVYDHMNDPNYRGTKKFLEKHPKAGYKMNREQFLKEKSFQKNTDIIPEDQPSEEDHINKFYRDNPVPIIESQGYTIEDIDEGEYFDPNQSYITWEEENGEYVCYPQIEKPNPVNMIGREVIVDDHEIDNEVIEHEYDKRLFTDEEIIIDGKLRNQTSLADFDEMVEAQSNIFELPDNYDMYCKPDPIYCDVHKVWDCSDDHIQSSDNEPSWHVCRHPYPEPTLEEANIRYYKNYTQWRREARWTCACGGNIQWHLDKENELYGEPASVKERMLLNYSIFTSQSELPHDLSDSDTEIYIIPRKDYKRIQERSIFQIDKPSVMEEQGVEVDPSILTPLFEIEQTLSQQMQELLLKNGENFILSDGRDKYVFDTPIQPPQPIKRKETLLDEVLKEEAQQYKKISRHNRKEDLIVHTVPTKEQMKYTELFLNEVKKRPVDFIEHSEYWQIEEDTSPFHSIPEIARRKMRYIGRMTEFNSDFDMYALTDFKKGQKLVQSIIMADQNKLWYTIRNMKGHSHNRGIHLTNDRKGDHYIVNGYRYPVNLIEPYVWDRQNKHGLVICQQVKVPKGGSTLFIPLGDGKATLAVTGEKIAK